MNDLFYSLSPTKINPDNIYAIASILILLSTVFLFLLIKLKTSIDIRVKIFCPIFAGICIVSIVIATFLENINVNIKSISLDELRKNVEIKLNSYRSFTYNSDVAVARAITSLNDKYDYCIMDDKGHGFENLYPVYPKNQAEEIYSQLDSFGALSGFTLTLYHIGELTSFSNFQNKFEKDFCNCLFVTNINNITVKPVSDDEEVLNLYSKGYEEHAKRTALKKAEDILTKQEKKKAEQAALEATSYTVELSDPLTKQYLMDNWHSTIQVLTVEGDVLDILLENIKLIPDSRTYLKYNSTELIEIHCLESEPNTPPDTKVNTSVDVNVKVNQQ